jgi:FkbM family methyltransferase
MNKEYLINYYLKNKHEFITEDPHEILLSKLKKIIKPINDKNIKVIGIDVGACIGSYLHHIHEICCENNSQILCFEPNPVNNKILEESIKNISFIKLFKCAISNENSILPFYNYKNNNENSIGNLVGGLRSGGEKISNVEVYKLNYILDNEFNNENIIIKFIKIDTEGNDGEVIKGFQKYLDKTQYIIFECSDCLDDFRGPGIKNPMKNIVDFLSNNGFDTYRIGTQKLFKVNDEYWDQTYEDVKFWSNCFALKKDDDLINDLIDNNFNYKL